MLATLPKSLRSLKQPFVAQAYSVCLFNTHYSTKRLLLKNHIKQCRFYSTDTNNPQENTGSKAASYDTYLDRGYSMITSQAYQLAIKDFTTAISLDGNDPRGYGSRADCFLETGQYQSALYDYEQVVKLDPRSVPSLASIGYCYSKLGDKARALEIYDRVLALDPKYKAARGERADLRLQVGMHELAVQDYLNILEDEPTNTKALLAVGKVAVMDQDFENAYTLYNKIVNISVSDMNYRENVFTSKENQGRKFSENKTEQYTEAWTGLGLVAAYTGKPEESIKAYSEAISLSPNLAHLYLQRANLYLVTCQFDKAMADINTGLNLVDETEGNDELKLSFLLIKGTCLGQQEKFPEAVSFISTFLQDRAGKLDTLTQEELTKYLAANTLRSEHLLQWWVKLNRPLVETYESTHGLHMYIENKGKEYSETILTDQAPEYLKNKKGNKILKEAIDGCLRTISIGKKMKAPKKVIEEGYVLLYLILNYIDPEAFLGFRQT
eukprot:TRINITY_DN866_c0_g1_i1.p1 TRINITY_DN866_c0_g1~~TRINITY_DN866_c0_g1_i1.p1  ORF type:complete len:496 (+),score=78.29 TRINITY_DN866_c0_g1_i1:240-1727(+)